MSVPPQLVRRAISPVREFLQREAAGGIVLAVATVAALVWANSPVGESYHDLWHAELGGHTLHDWISDGLMAIFFLVVGLEIRREIADGELSDRRTATLPALAAVGGMVAPALVYVAFNVGGASEGWAIPTATDIAFAVGVVTLLGDRVPAAGRIFLLALAIVDDILAILVIALFYGTGLAPLALVAAFVLFAAYAVVSRRGLPWPLLLLLAVGTWYATWRSGVHATIAGVAIGLATPTAKGVQHESIGERLEHRLHPYSVFLVLPLFALANAGVELSSETLNDALGSPVAYGVVLGLVVGKPLGITVATLLAVRAGIARLPEGLSWRGVVGVASVAGIGFTVSLFITTLAFGSGRDADDATLAIFAGSVLSGLVGAALLARGSRTAPAAAAE